jgi:3-hydroxyacyl-CoA dehydrogenase
MGALVELGSDHDVAIITINNPPVNALSPGVVEGLSKAVEQVCADERVLGVVLVGSGRTFVSGGDINEFVKFTSGKKQRDGSILLQVLLRIENCNKPMVVAIHGNALGGGLELAMAAHYRLAVPSAQVGQPEVKLGIIPGAAGTQRLPRLAGVAKALEMCTEGKPVAAQEALRLGIVDQLIEGDLLTGAVAFARGMVGKPVRRTRDLTAKLGIHEQNAALFAAAREASAKKNRGFAAPLAAIDAVEAATELPFDKGCEVEQRLFTECLFSETSKAMIHLFFAGREIAKIPDIPRDTPKDMPLVPVKAAAVLGAGFMGSGIAMVFANAGIPVVLKDADEVALHCGMDLIRRNYAASVERGRLTQAFVDERLELIRPTLRYEDFSDADIVVEAIFENMAAKKVAFEELDRICKRGAILATNTSSLDIDAIASVTSRPNAVIGMHFFSPAPVMRLLEVVRGQKTSKEVIASCMHLAKKIGKLGVLVGNCPGFVGNRMFGLYRREAQFLVEEGADIEEVDKALYNFGMAMGPLRTADLVGLDIRWRIRREHRHLERSGVRQPILEDRLCEMGRFGQKTGGGWYKYVGDRTPIPDAEVARLVRLWSADAGIRQRQCSPSEIVERCIYSLVNEGARILEEGCALRASDIDIIYVNGYGFPEQRGGPMWYASVVGLGTVYQRTCELQRQHGELWAPAALLKRLAERGETFADYDKMNASRTSVVANPSALPIAVRSEGL